MKDDHDRRLNDFCQAAASDVTWTARLAAGDLRIVLAELLETLPRQRSRPRLDVGRSEIGGDVRRVADLDAELPQPRQIRMAVRGAGRCSGEIRLAVGRPRHTGRWLPEPLSSRGRRNQQHNHEKGCSVHWKPQPSIRMATESRRSMSIQAKTFPRR